MILFFIIDLLLTAVFLNMIAAVLPNLEIDGRGPAVLTAAIMRVAGFALGSVTARILAPFLGIGGWITFGISSVLTVIVLAIAVNTVPGVKAGGGWTVVFAGVLLEVLRTGASFATRLADTSGLFKGLN